MTLFGNALLVNIAQHSYVTSGYQSQKARKHLAMKNEPVKKKHKKKHKSSPRDEEPLVNALKSKRTSKITKEELPTLYREDLGTAGVKLKHNGFIVSSPQASFNVPLTTKEELRRKERQMRFSSSNISIDTDIAPDALSSALSTSRGDLSSKKSTRKRKKNKLKADNDLLVGTCLDVLKPYLRLTDFPKVEDVRPLETLTKALTYIKSRYIQTEDMEWANEQLKSVRQDITVQGLKNAFVLQVYETHARILLEHGDLNEFNQCQTMIRTLTTGITGSNCESGNGSEVEDPKLRAVKEENGTDAILNQSEEAADEFGSYRLLYALVQNSMSDVTKELSTATHIINQDQKRSIRDPDRMPRNNSCRHAILVSKAITHNDYRAFFRLYDNAPHLTCFLMDFLVKRIRDGAYKRIVAAYRPMISLETFREKLCLQDLEETRTFLKQSGAVFVEEKGEPSLWVDCKASKY